MTYFLFGIWLLVLLITFWIYKKFPVYTRKEIFTPITDSPSYSFTQRDFFFHSVNAIFFVIGFFVLAVVFAYYFPAMQEYMFVHFSGAAIPNVVVLPSENYMFVILPAMLIFLMLLGIVQSLVYMVIFPNFFRFESLVHEAQGFQRRVTWKQLKTRLSKLPTNIDYSKLYSKIWKETALLFTIIWATAGLLVVMMLDTYTIVSSDHVVVNPFLGLQEQSVLLKEVSRAQLFTEREFCNAETPCVRTHFTLIFNNGQSIDLWRPGSSLSEMYNVYKFVQAASIQPEIVPLDLYTISLLNHSGQADVALFFDFVSRF